MPEVAASPDDDVLLIPDAVATLLSWSRERVLDEAKSGNLPSVRLSQRSIRFRKTDVDRYISARLFYGDVAAELERVAT
jgi:excisionase family DNA binding protein